MEAQASEPSPAFAALKRKYNAILNENWTLFDQVEKYRETIKKLSSENRLVSMLKSHFCQKQVFK